MKQHVDSRYDWSGVGAMIEEEKRRNRRALVLFGIWVVIGLAAIYAICGLLD